MQTDLLLTPEFVIYKMIIIGWIPGILKFYSQIKIIQNDTDIAYEL